MVLENPHHTLRETTASIFIVLFCCVTPNLTLMFKVISYINSSFIENDINLAAADPQVSQPLSVVRLHTVSHLVMSRHAF